MSSVRPRVANISEEDEEEDDGNDSDSSTDTLIGEDEEGADGAEVDLESFRAQWEQELKTQKKEELEADPVEEEESEEEKKGSAEGGVAEKENPTSEEEEIRNKARAFFLAGAELERTGDHFSAIRNYKKAEQLVPNIERITFRENAEAEAEKEKQNKAKRKDNASDSEDDDTGGEGTFAGVETVPTDAADLSGEEIEEDLILRFTKMCVKEVCSKDDMSTFMCHISTLPPELIVQILKWVVSSDLDLRSLERTSSTCRGFYLASRAAEIWKLICTKTWGADNIPKYPVNDWRAYYLSRPKVQLSGCYIGRTTYYREGERGFQDQYYRSWHTVVYYRYIRFYPEGKVMMVTSAEEPANAVKLLSSRHNPGIAGTMHGTYKFVKNRVIGHVRKPGERHSLCDARHRRRRRSALWIDIPEQEFHFEFEVQGKRNNQIHWVRYQVITLPTNGPPSTADMDVSSSTIIAK